MIINRIYEHQNLLSLQLVSFLVGLRTYQHPVYGFCLLGLGIKALVSINCNFTTYETICLKKVFAVYGQSKAHTYTKGEQTPASRMPW